MGDRRSLEETVGLVEWRAGSLGGQRILLALQKTTRSVDPEDRCGL